LGATTPATTRAPVLFPPQLARSLFGHFLGAISGGLLYRDASFLKDRVGETIFSPQVCLAQRPFLLKGAGSAGFDAEGVATVDRDLVDQGVLGGYLLSSYSARRLGLQTTGNAGGVFNLTVSPGDQDLPGLIRQMDRGLLVNELMGQGVSLMTGDYSRGASGFWVENGEIAYPVENITIASSLQAMFKGIVALGNDVDPFSLVRSPSLLIDQMTIAGA
jgi:PmbA protein